MDATYTGALAAADQEYTHVTDTLATAANQARGLLASANSPTEAWATLSTQIARQLDCTNKRQLFACTMLAAAVIRLAQTEGQQP